MGSTAICIRIADIDGDYVRYVKKMLRKMRTKQEVRLRNHAMNVSTGSEGSSVSGTTSATSLIGHQSDSTGIIPGFCGSGLMWLLHIFGGRALRKVRF